MAVTLLLIPLSILFVYLQKTYNSKSKNFIMQKNKISDFTSIFKSVLIIEMITIRIVCNCSKEIIICLEQKKKTLQWRSNLTSPPEL